MSSDGKMDPTNDPEKGDDEKEKSDKEKSDKEKSDKEKSDGWGILQTNLGS
jgi:hypothetical protein